jgi:hypothetical protein
VVDVSGGAAAAPPRPEPGGPPPDTFDIDEIVTLSGRRPGKVVVHLALRRVWETDKPPLERLDLDIVVTGQAVE